jgi:NADPH:quinone reductase-like Zn-dependent oxidoreductase
MPHNTAAYLTSGDNGTFEVKEAPYVKPGAGEVVIRNSAVAVNPRT